MTQFLRPDGDVTNEWASGGWAQIDEVTPSYSDYAYSADNPSADVLEVSLSNPAATPNLGTCTLRMHETQCDGGVVNSTGGTDVTYTWGVYQGGSTIAEQTGQLANNTGSWASRSLTFSTTLVTAWNDLRVRITADGGGGSPSNRRGMAVAWVELEVPNPPPYVLSVTAADLKPNAVSITGKITTPVTAAALTAGPQAIDLSATSGLSLSVTAASLTASPQAVTENFTVPVSAASLSASGQAVTEDFSVPVVSAALTCVGQALTEDVTLLVSNAALTGSGQTVTENISVPVSNGALTCTGQTITLDVTTSLTLDVTAAALTASPQNVSGIQKVSRLPASLTLVGQEITLSLVKLLSVTEASLTASGQPIVFNTTLNLTAASLTGVGQTITFSGSATVGISEETDTSFFLAKAKFKTVGLGVEADTGYSLGQLKIRLVGVSLTTDEAFAFAKVKARSILQGQETDEAFESSKLKTRSIDFGVESDSALALSGASAVGMAEETDAAYGLARVKVEAVTISVETDEATALSKVKLNAVLQSSETDESFVLSKLKLRDSGLVAETDEAFALTAALIGAIGRADEADTSETLLGFKLKDVQTSIESDISYEFTRTKLRAVAFSTETDTALKLYGGVGLSVETDVAFALSTATPVGLASEADLAYSPGVTVKARAITFAVEDDGLASVTTTQRIFRVSKSLDSIAEVQFVRETGLSSLTSELASLSVLSQSSTPAFLDMKPDGTKFFMIPTEAFASRFMYAYNVSSPWNLETGSYSGVSRTFTMTEAGCPLSGGFRAFKFKPDGTKLYICGYENLASPPQEARIFQYNLSTPWDISTISFEKKVSFSGISNWVQFDFSDDGSVLICAKLGPTAGVYRYNIGTAWDFATKSGETFVDIDTLLGGTYFVANESLSFENGGTELFFSETYVYTHIALAGAHDFSSASLLSRNEDVPTEGTGRPYDSRWGPSFESGSPPVERTKIREISFAEEVDSNTFIPIFIPVGMAVEYDTQLVLSLPAWVNEYKDRRLWQKFTA